jgi:hypothetical protein
MSSLTAWKPGSLRCSEIAWPCAQQFFALATATLGIGGSRYRRGHIPAARGGTQSMAAQATLYASSKDKAIRLSQKLHRNPRAGAPPLTMVPESLPLMYRQWAAAGSGIPISVTPGLSSPTFTRCFLLTLRRRGDSACVKSKQRMAVITFFGLESGRLRSSTAPYGECHRSVAEVS